MSTQNMDPSYEVYSHLTHNMWKWWGTFGFDKTQAILLLTEMLLASLRLWRSPLLGSALSWSDYLLATSLSDIHFTVILPSIRMCIFFWGLQIRILNMLCILPSSYMWIQHVLLKCLFFLLFYYMDFVHSPMLKLEIETTCQWHAQALSLGRKVMETCKQWAKRQN